ncbi:LysR family transcriptional regulator [Nocardioides endophyticus]|uniref:LysR family transcriptional regulator n=1 Tax=Nocardioides endophyticus TaxID=1353775 RepID=UPI0031E9C6A5
MEHRQLVYAVAISDHGSFTRAAAECFVVQSALSQQIRKLEDELGIRIFDRHPRSVSLTPDGEALLPAIREAVGAFEQVRTTAQELSGAVRGRVTLGLMAVPPATVQVAGLVADFHRAHPGVDVTISSGHSMQLREQVRRGELDCAVVGVPSGPESEGLRYRASLVEDLCLVVPQGHQLAGRPQVAADQLVDQRFVDFPTDYALRQELDRLLTFERRIAFEVTRVEQVVQFVERGLAIGVLPRSVVASWSREVALVPVAIEGNPTRRVALVLPAARTGTAAARAFAEAAARSMPG